MKTITFLILSQIFLKCNGDLIKNGMYENVEAVRACFRRLNGTHQVGCTSNSEGSTGVVHFCTQQEDIDFILNKGNAPPYVFLIPTQLFTSYNVENFIKTKKTAGVVLYRDGTKLTNFTHEQQCPNSGSNIKNTCEEKWNPKGTGLLHTDIPFPIFYIEDNHYVDLIKDCYNNHNNYSFETQNDRSLCVIQLSSFMYATVNSQTCLRRSNSWVNLIPVKFCDALGDQNVWASLFPLYKGENYNESVNFNKYIVISARMDTTSMFEKTAGAESPVTGLVTLLATAKLLKEILPENKDYDTNVLFVLFNGETYDYIGSQRFVYDLENNGSHIPPIKLNNISLFIELSQLANSGNLVAHYLYPHKNLEYFLDKLTKNSKNLKFSMSNGTLPPASFHTFLKANENIPGLVLTNHKLHYFNSFYNSIYDNSSNIGFIYKNNVNKNKLDDSVQMWIKGISEIISKSIYEEIVKKPPNGKIEGDLQLINELFNCYLEDSNCKVHQAIQKLKLKRDPQSLYVGVDFAHNLLTNLIGLTLSWVTGDDVTTINPNCTRSQGVHGVRYFNMSQSLNDLNITRCFRVFMNFTKAVSPAFIIEDYDWTSGLYSTWTESTWADIKMRIFLQPSKAHENLTISIGSIVLIFSFLLTYFIKSRSDILFSSTLPTIAPANC